MEYIVKQKCYHNTLGLLHEGETVTFTKDEVAACEPSNCIRCGRCISVCPAGLMPTSTLYLNL
ncbi:4Fe-4S binding protein [uncultured Veillonella sp.]|uniref:4Fe-4S binding protein n=1 Tax=uncultured Veillonella sp. TaxID=159268 RepID=UPI00345BFEC2